MARDNPEPDLKAALAKPQIALMGEVNQAMATNLRDGLREQGSGDDGPVVVEITTVGGDAELVRRMSRDVDEARKSLAPRRLVFIGQNDLLRWHYADVRLPQEGPLSQRGCDADDPLPTADQDG